MTDHNRLCFVGAICTALYLAYCATLALWSMRRPSGLKRLTRVDLERKRRILTGILRRMT